MANSKKPVILTFLAGEDLSAKKNHFVKFGADKETVVAAGANDKTIGILQNDPTSGGQAEVATYGGGAKLQVSEAISLLDLLTPTADGEGEQVDAVDEWCGAIATEDATANNDIIGVEVVAFFSSKSDA